MQIASVKHFHRRYGNRHQLKAATREGQLREVVKLAAKEGYAFHRDGRAYIPEALRGKGVGYGKHGA
jgi:hypothetical protein